MITVRIAMTYVYAFNPPEYRWERVLFDAEKIKRSEWKFDYYGTYRRNDLRIEVYVMRGNYKKIPEDVLKSVLESRYESFLNGVTDEYD